MRDQRKIFPGKNLIDGASPERRHRDPEAVVHSKDVESPTCADSGRLGAPDETTKLDASAIQSRCPSCLKPACVSFHPTGANARNGLVFAGEVIE
jgi:Fe-S-cluster-containing dehydrogenase component